MNRKIKFRESFRPFAPVVLREFATEYFDLPLETDSPYMLLVAQVAAQHRRSPEEASEAAVGIEKLQYCRSDIPAVTHVDFSARVQTVDQERSPLLHRLLTAFHRRTACPVLINTSFNVRNEPIVCSPDDAWQTFMMTDMDVLAAGRHLLFKSRQPNQLTEADRQRYRGSFELD